MTAETVLDLLDGVASGEQQRFWQQHLESCEACRRQMDEWRMLRMSLTRSHLQDAPVDDMAKVLAFFPAPRPWRNSICTIKFAALVFDSLAQPASAGSRGPAPFARQIVLSTEEFDVHVRIWSDVDRKRLLGQLMPRSPTTFIATARLHLLHNGLRYESTVADPMGEFQFHNIPEGPLSLQIDLPHVTVIGVLNITEVH